MVRNKVSKETDSFITVKVREHDAEVDGGINVDLLGYQSGFTNPEAPEYRFESSIKLAGNCSYPEDREDHYFEMQLYSSQTLSSHLSQIVKDLHKVDKSNMPIYRKRKNICVPVYEKPLGLALVDKVRGKDAWTIWMQVDRQTISDAFAIIGLNKQIYLTIHEKIENRKRWVQSFTIQTTDPDNE